MKLFLVDGNNLACRVAFVHSNLRVFFPIPIEANPDDTDKYSFPTGVLFGFFKILAMLKNNYPCHYFAIVWDGGYRQRLALTQEALQNKIIPSLYKANRKKDVIAKEWQYLHEQKPELRAMISLTNIPQIEVQHEEADDVIASYAKKYSSVAEDIIIYTQDQDYYQLLRNNVRLLIKDQLLDANLFKTLKKYYPSQHTDIGALQGDSSDNIHGVPSFGEKTAEEKIIEFGSLENMLAEYHKKLDPLRVQYPDLDKNGIIELKSIKTPKGGQKWVDVYPNMPFSGVALALEKKLIKEQKTTILALMFEERAKLAKRLKTMNSDILVPDLPGWNNTEKWDRNGKEPFLKYCKKYQLNEISARSEILCAQQ